MEALDTPQRENAALRERISTRNGPGTRPCTRRSMLKAHAETHGLPASAPHTARSTLERRGGHGLNVGEPTSSRYTAPRFRPAPGTDTRLDTSGTANG